MAPGHVRIEVAAAGVNFADTMARTGLYPDAPKPPMVVGYEVAGTVAEVAADVDGRGGRRPRDGRDEVRRLRVRGRRAGRRRRSRWRTG